jgi:hypothetical protein
VATTAGLDDDRREQAFCRVSVHRVRVSFYSASFGKLHSPETRCRGVRVCEATGTLRSMEEPGIAVIAYIEPASLAVDDFGRRRT